MRCWRIIILADGHQDKKFFSANLSIFLRGCIFFGPLIHLRENRKIKKSNPYFIGGEKKNLQRSNAFSGAVKLQNVSSSALHQIFFGRLNFNPLLAPLLAIFHGMENQSILLKKWSFPDLLFHFRLLFYSIAR